MHAPRYEHLPSRAEHAAPTLQLEVLRVVGGDRLEVKEEGKSESLVIHVPNALDYVAGTKLSFKMKGAKLGRFAALKGSIEHVEMPVTHEEISHEDPLAGDGEEEDGLLPERAEESVAGDEYEDDAEPYFIEEREADPSPNRYVPRFIVGVVEEDGEGGMHVRIDRAAGYPQNMLQSGKIPETVDAGFGVSPGKIVAFRREDLGESGMQWVTHEVCGDLGDTRAEIRALAYRSNTTPEFSDGAVAQVERLKARYEAEGDRAFMEREAVTYADSPRQERMDGRLVREKEDYVHGETRLDLRDREDIDIFTIDPPDARDFDDAISFREIERDGKKCYEIGMHIADLEHFVRLGSPLERDARFRQFTRYLELNTIPMLPELIANQLASLEPDKDRLAYSTILTLDEDGTLLEKPWFGRSLIRSKKRFTYDEADAVLKNTDDERHARMTKLQTFTQKMRTARDARGSITFDQKAETKVRFKEGRAVGLSPKHRAQTSFMIEDLMLAANEAQGAYLREQFGEDAPLLLRAHDAPPASQVARAAGRLLKVDRRHADNAELRTIIASYEKAHAKGAGKEAERAFLESGAVPKIINLFQKRLRETSDAKVVAVLEQSLRSLLKRARYTTKREKHFSLAVEPYLHATSPIRRYPDLMVQYLMDQAQRGRTGISLMNEATQDLLEEVAERANIAHQLSRKAQEDVRTIAFLDILGAELESAGPSGITLSGMNAVVRDTDVRRGIRMTLKITGGSEQTIWIPWNETSARENEDGELVVRHTRAGKPVTDTARDYYGPVRDGVRTLAVRIVGIDRARRKPLIQVGKRKTYWDEEREPTGPRGRKK